MNSYPLAVPLTGGAPQRSGFLWFRPWTALQASLACLAAFAGCIAQANAHIPAAPPGQIETGVPNFVTFGKDALGFSSSCTDLRLLPDGRIVIVAQRELVIGDGVRWDLIRKAEGEGDPEVITESVGVNGKGELFTGLRAGFGKLVFGEDGRWRFKLVAPMPELGARSRPAFQSAEQVGDNWYWHSSSGALLRWNMEGGSKLLGNVDNIDRIFSHGSTLFVSNRSDGSLFRLDEGGSTRVIGPEETNLTRSISCAAPYNSDLLMVGTTSAGLMLFDGRALTPVATKGVLSGGRRINDLCVVGSRFFAAAVDTFGIVFFDRSGRVIQTLDRTMDHRLSRVKRLLYTSEGVLWALLNDGVTRIEFPSRISYFEPMLNAGLGYVEPVRHQGRLWLHADGKVLRGQYDGDNRLLQFVEDSPPGPNCWRLSSETGHLLSSGEDGIFERQEQGWVKIIPRLVNARLVVRSARPDWWFFVARRKAGLVHLGGAHEVESVDMPAVDDCYGAYVDGRGMVWLELGMGRVGRLDPSSFDLRLEVLGGRNGIPESWPSLYVLDGVLRLNSANKVLKFDEAARRFVDDTELLASLPALQHASGRLMRDALGRIWMSGLESVQLLSSSPEDPNKVLETMPAELRPDNFVDDDAGVVWMHDRRRFARYDPSMPKPEIPRPRAVIQRVDLSGSGRSFFSPSADLPALAYADNSIAVQYCAPGSPMGSPVTFEFMLEGAGGNWISTGIVGSAVFNRLKEGGYVLRVRPVSDGTPGEEARLGFRILPPWHRTPLAYLSFSLAAVLALSAAIALPVLFQKRHKRRLEELVAARTQELHDTNLLLARQVKETLEKASDLKATEDRYRRLSTELERRVEDRTEELKDRIRQVEELNHELRISQRAADSSAARLQEANANLLVANQELESFSYSVSHDLRAPLRNMSGFIELLRRRIKGMADKECDRYTDIISSEAVRMGALIDDLLTFSRIGRSEMRLQALRIEPIVEQVRHELSHDLSGRNVEWIIAPLPAIMGDETLLRQVIANLLGNAVKFTRRREKAVIEIGAEPLGESSRMATIFVKDNGVGFNPQYVDKLFNVFQRLHASRDFEGTGIGLANVKRIVTRHGGRVWAVGKPDAGAIFFFTLKLAAPDDASKAS